jgi:tetratricopeptide (TPR) repeat protein
VLGLTVALAIAGQVAGWSPTVEGDDTSRPAAGAIGAGGTDAFANPPDGGPLGAGPTDVERIRENVAFWSARSTRQPNDFISSTRWAASEIDLARATGDVSRYLAADGALDRALTASPEHRPALGYRGAVLVALHEFEAARDHARTVLAAQPGDPVALATLGDAALALGDMDTARGAYQELSLVADSAAARVRASHLAFVDGDPVEAVALSRAALEAALDEGLEGSSLTWFRYQLGDALASTGDLDGAAAAFAGALRDDPSSPLAHWGLARIAAAGDQWDEAIAHLDAAIAIVPSPEFVARRADLYGLRGGSGDDRRERDDRRTVLAIGSLAGDAAAVYDRTLSLYLSSRGDRPERALELAESELAARRDVYGYDALAWALLANDRAGEAREAMTEALALGTRDAKLLFHAGMIEAELGNMAAARSFLEDALATDPSFDPVAVRAARATLAALS